MKKLFLAFAFVFISLHIWAVPATPYPIEMTQPDGSTITVCLHGDEYYSYYALPDGTPLRRLESGFFQKDSSVLLPAEEVQTRLRKAQQTHLSTTFPLTGSPRSLVVLMGFTDQPFAQTKADFEALLNESGYSYNNATGSARDYFIASSDSVFSPIFDVYGPYTAEHDMAYYGAPSGDSKDKDPYSLIAEACQRVHDAGINLKQYDTDNDGVLDNVFVFYAGNNQAEGASENTIWPHRGDLVWKNITIDGVRLSSYACTSEYRGTDKTRASIGTFCHEFGHVLGLPDFYDTTYDHYTIANWDIMCSGSYNNKGNTPPTYASHERFFLGWLQPKQLTEAGEYYLEPLTTSNSAYLIAAETHNMVGSSPSPKEYFLLEYRNRSGWETPSGSLPGTGMLVWHIDYSESAWANNTPNNGTQMLRTHLEEANGISWKDRGQKEDGRASDPYPGTNNVTSFIPKLHDGTPLDDQHVFNITEEDGLVRFIYQALGNSKVSAEPRSLSLTTTLSDANKIESWVPQSFMLIGEGIDSVGIKLSITGNYYLTAAEKAPARTDKAWKKSITILPAADSTVNERIWVSFAPVKRDCNSSSAVVNISGNGVGSSVAITAYAPRHTYVQTPEVNPISNISPYSFRFSWVPESDATEYFLTLYKVSKGTATFIQGFENFNNAEAVRNEGWESTTNATTTSAKSEGNRALYLKATGDCITTEDYQSAVSEITFWINAFSTDVDTVGVIDIEGWNGTEWIALNKCRTIIKSTTKKKIFAYSFNGAESYSRFRLTYTNNGGSGCAMDAFTATCSQNIEYIYKGTDLSVYAVDDPAYTIYDFTNLTPSTTYYCSVQASDAGMGCEEHRTALSAPLQVTTLAAEADAEKYLTIGVDSINYDAPTRVVYVPNPTNGNILQIFDWSGRLVYQCEVIAGISAYPIPAEQMNRGAVYIIKYIEQNDKGALKMKRKQRFAKFIL